MKGEEADPSVSPAKSYLRLSILLPLPKPVITIIHAVNEQTTCFISKIGGLSFNFSAKYNF